MNPRTWSMLLGLASIAGCSANALDGSGSGGGGGQGGSSGGGLTVGDEFQSESEGLPAENRKFDERTEWLQVPLGNATACTANNQCPTGYCVDGFCCDSKCDNKCMACSAAKKGSGIDGICGSIAYDTDPDNDCPFGACDGKNMCKNYNGVACASPAQCLSNYCVDGYCCGNICMGACQACSTTKKGNGYNGVCGAIAANTDPDNECNPGECNGTSACNSPQTPAANGTACTSAAQCASGYCADGFCCDSWCLGNCQACSAAKKGNGINGICGNIANDQDPDEECWGGSCDGKGTCKQYNGVPCTAKSQCLSGYCVDGVCCGNICNLQCQACSEGRKGQGYDGVCGPIAAGKDPDNECNPGECGGAGSCNQPQTPQSNGSACVTGAQCASNYCVDGVCCDTACAGSCQACTAAKKGSGVDGTCGNIGYDQDPDEECYGGGCSGAGSCKYYNGLACASGADCLSNYCVDGYCCNNVCIGACAACSTAKKGSGFNGVCGFIAANTDPDNECTNGECTGSGSCNSPQQPAPNGTVCASAAQCASGFCVDGVCCSNSCNDPCLACTATKKGQGSDGTCGPIIAGIDPDNECVNSDCNGSGACVAPTNLPNGTSCTASSECASTFCVDAVCCDSACTGSCQACSATKKGQGTNGTCGSIKYDTDPDEECYAGACNGSGACQYYNSAPCGQDSQCLSGYCVDGFCCNNHCGGLCYACSAAKKGNGTDGVCSFISATLDPDAECPATYCSGSGTCAVNSCTSQLDCPSTASCIGNKCVCNSGYSGTGLVCSDINECLANNGGCNVDATCMNMPGSRICECNPGFAGDGFTCTDIDECQMNNGGCSVNATCTNTPGSRTCTCKFGYTGDGITCTFDGSIVAAASQSSFVCARGANDSAKCWGINSFGHLGLGDTNSRGDNPNEMGSNLPPLALGTGRTIQQVAAGYTHACVILDGGSVKCWGNNQNGKLGLGDVANRGDNWGEMGDNLPLVDLGTGQTAVDVGAGVNHTCALLQSGAMKCWGGNSNGVLGIPNAFALGDQANEMGNNLPTVELGTGKTAVAISIGGNISCVILNDGTPKCWGSNQYGELGQGSNVPRGAGMGDMGDNLPPIDLGNGKTAVKIATGRHHVCAILNDGNLKCWGNNDVGQLGLGDKINRGDNPGEMGDNLPAVDLGIGKTAIDVGVNYSHTCALLNDGTVKCWGGDAYGCLGREAWATIGDEPGEMGDNLIPVNFGTGRTAKAVITGQYSTCVILDDNKLKCWGDNSYGQLGQGNTIPRGQNLGSMGDNLPIVPVY